MFHSTISSLRRVSPFLSRIIPGSRRSVSILHKFTTIDDNDRFWLGRLEHKDWLAPNEVLKVFKGIWNADLLYDAYEKLSTRKDYKPTEDLYSLLVDRLACAQKFSTIGDLLERIKSEKCKVSDEFVYKVIKMYGNVANHPKPAIKTLFKMPEFHCWPTVKTFNFVLNMLFCGKRFEVIHEIYLSGPKLGVALDTCSFNILIKGLCKCGRLDAAFSLLHEMPKQGCRPNVKTYSTLMYFLCQKDKVKDAFDLYERMESNGCYPDTVAFNILISGLCREGNITEGMGFLKKMKLKGCYPNSDTYQALLYGLLSTKQFVKAREFMDLMLAEGGCPSFLSYKLLVQGLCDENFLTDAERVLEQMVQQGFAPRMGTWRSLLQCLFSNATNLSRDNIILKLETWKKVIEILLFYMQCSDTLADLTADRASDAYDLGCP